MASKRVYRALRLAHFLPFEIREFARTVRITPSGKRIRVQPLPLNIPWIKDMIRERARGYRAARKAGLSNREFNEMIVEDMYAFNELLDDNGEPDPWQYLRRQKEKYKDKHPDYESPYKAKKPKGKDFTSKYAKGLEKYERGRGR